MSGSGTGLGDRKLGELGTAVHGDGGFSMVELLVAVLMLVLTALATFSLLDVGTRTTFRAEESQAMLNVAQREMEELRSLDYEELALTAQPGSDPDPDHPLNRVSGSTFDLGDGSAPAELVVNGAGGVSGGTVDPGPEAFQSGDISGEVYRFVVWRDDPGCLLICPGTRDYKRAVVAVRVNEGVALSSALPYEELASDFTDPDRTAADTDAPGVVGEVVTGQQLYLSDTRCQIAAGDPIRTTPTDHPTHETTGTCGGTGKPDALIAGAPPSDPINPPLHDYATEIEPAGSGPCDPEPPEGCYPNDAGLQLLRPGTDGCDYTPGGSGEHQVVHRWVTQTMPVPFETTGKATLELFTRTIEDLPASGKICVYLFTRGLDLLGQPIDTLIADAANPSNDHFTISQSAWPSGSWSSLKLQMQFAPTPIQIGDRLGIAISIERTGTTPDILQFAYDHVDYESRLEVLTTTPLS